jgi:16S rRNA C967 or C1407 C5-methylase (RsmB/RsmF family)
LRRAGPALNFQLSTCFDRILVDAPCSNTGVMRRRVDLRRRVQPKEIGRLHDTQLDLLKTSRATGETRQGSGLQHVQPGAGGKR